MADSIFTEDELKAEETQASPEDATQDQPRGPDGKFVPKEEPKAEAPAVETTTEAEPEAEEAKEKPQGTVPQGALHAEREKRKTVEAELKAVREQIAALATMREQIASRKPEDLPAGDDPAAVEHLRQRLAQIEQGQTRVEQRLDTQAVNQAEMQQLGGVMAQSEALYRQEKPDYDSAIEHVVKARAAELALYGLTPPQIQQTISEEATEIVRSAVAQGRDPAELGYQIALSRGYRPAGPAETTETPPQGQAQRTLDAIAQAKAQGKSLGGAGGGKVATLNAEAVLAMSPEDFAAVYSTPEGKAMIDSL